MDLTVHATLDAIKADAVAVLGEMAKKAEAYAIVEKVNHPLICVTLDQCRFHAMVSGWDALEKADGKKIFIWHLNGMENMPCGAAYNGDEKRLWPGAPGDCLDHKRYADTLKKTVPMAMCAPLRCSAPIITSSPMRRTSRRQPRSHAPMWRLIADFSGSGAVFIIQYRIFHSKAPSRFRLGALLADLFRTVMNICTIQIHAPSLRTGHMAMRPIPKPPLLMVRLCPCRRRWRIR